MFPSEGATRKRESVRQYSPLQEADAVIAVVCLLFQLFCVLPGLRGLYKSSEAFWSWLSDLGRLLGRLLGGGAIVRSCGQGSFGPRWLAG